MDNPTATYSGNQIALLRYDAADVLLESSLDMPHGQWSGSDFAYDRNGNQTRDLSRGVSDIRYNELNLPARIEMASGGTIEYLYSADGTKLAEIVRDSKGNQMNHRNYIGMFEFTDDSLRAIVLSSGFVSAADTTFHLYVHDYQGNVTGVYNTRSGALEQFTDFYPYGLPHTMTRRADAASNRRLYSAKELTTDHALNTYDFEARVMAPAFPRFTSPDPFADYAWNLTPYRFCFDDPINYIDPYGLFETYNEAYEYARTLPTFSTPRFDYISGKWFVPLNEAGTDGYVSGDTVTRFFGDQNPYSNPYNLNYSFSDYTQPYQMPTWLDNLNTGVGAFESANSVKQELIFWIANDANKRAGVAAEWGVGGVEAAYGKTMANYSRICRGISFVSAGVTTYSALTEIKGVLQDGDHYERLIKPTIDIVMTGIGLWGGPIGVGISCAYFIVDLMYQNANEK